MPKQTLQQFGQTIKAKHPEYADMGDEDVAQKVLAKYPQYGDMVDTSQQAGPSANAMRVPGLPDHAPAPVGLTSNAAGDSPDWRARLFGNDGSQMVKTPVRHVTQALQGVAQMAMHPVNTAKAVVQQTGDSVRDAYQKAKAGDYAGAANSAADAIPVVGPWARQVENDAHQYGVVPAMLGVGADALTAEAPGAALKGVGKLNPRVALASHLDEMIPGTDVTARERYAAAQRTGVQLDLADATNHPLAVKAKELGQHSLTGSGTYEAAKMRNIAALNDSTTGMLDGMSPLDAEQGGKLVQDRLKADQKQLHGSATAGYDQLDAATGSTPLDNLNGVAAVGDDFLKENRRYDSMFKTLAPGKANAIADDVRNMNYRVKGPGWGEMQRLRSDMLDLSRQNPDLISTRTGALYDNVAGAADKAMEENAAALPGELAPVWRDANAKWKDMKTTYDDPVSPLYHAVRNPSPSTLARGVGDATPENVRNLAPRIGADAMGVIQRGVAEKMLGTAPGTSEAYNFRSLPTQLSRLPAEYGQELYGNGNLARLKDVSVTARALEKDLNPSGTAKQGQKFAEAGMMLPTGGLPLLQYPLAKFMNSPKVVNYFMRDAAPAATAGAGVVAPLRYGTYASGPISRAVNQK